jgi:hypothetical protein
MNREEMIAMAEQAGLKVDSRWSDATLAQKLEEATKPLTGDEVKADNILSAMGEPLLKVICTCENVYLGDFRAIVKRKGETVENCENLINRDTCDLPESMARFLDSREQVAIVG